MGLRETKKARTRKRISDLARDLFLAKGFANVTVAEIAAEAEVAVTTLFNYFPSKEAIIFDLEDEIDEALIDALRGRENGSMLDALHKCFAESSLINPPNSKNLNKFMKLVRSAPELTHYFRSLWDRYAVTITKEFVREGISKPEAECLAQLILEGVKFACCANSPKEALNTSFKILKSGWKK